MILWILLFASSIVFASSGIIKDPKEEKCNRVTSCSMCLASDTSCVWCVKKNQCKRSCGTNIAIFPETSSAMLAGSQFCPRVSEVNKELVLKTGIEESIAVKVTQVHIYMAFRRWKCKIIMNKTEILVNATIVAGTVYCDPVVLDKVWKERRSMALVQVLWEDNNGLDGYYPIKVV